MTQMTVHKEKIHEILLRFLNDLQADEIHLEFDEKHFLVQPVQEKTVLDMLAEQADDLGPEDLSLNTDHYLYGLPKRPKR